MDGKTHSVQDFCEAAFGHAGLNWQDYVEIGRQFCVPRMSIRLAGTLAESEKISVGSPRFRLKTSSMKWSIAT